MSIVVNKTRLPVTQWQTESGSVVSISDARKRYAKSLSVALEPIQDLHGYANPWAGGCGKNKFDVSKMVNTADIIINNGVISVTGNAQNSTKKLSELADLTVGETYTLTANNTGTENIIYLYGTGANVSWAFGTSKTITQEMLNALVFFYGGSNTTSQISNFMIRLASVTDATYAPYANICPISGTSSVTAVRCGKNLLNDSLRYVASATNVYIGAENNGYHIPLKAGTYTFSADIGEAYAAYFREANDSGNTPLWQTGSALRSKKFTVSSDGLYRFWFYRSTANGGVDPTKIIHAQVELGSTATAYEPYQGISVTLSLGQTVYGGSVDLVSGVLTVTHGYLNFNTANMNNSENYPGWKNSGVTALIGTGINGRIVGAFTNVSDKSAYFNSGGVSANTRDNRDLVFLNNAYFNKNQTKWQALAMDIQIVIPLATPYTIQLTAHQIEMLMRNNTVWSDAGVVTLNYARIRQ